MTPAEEMRQAERMLRLTAQASSRDGRAGLITAEMVVPLADWIGDSADLVSLGGLADKDAARLLGRALQFARQVNEECRKTSEKEEGAGWMES